MKSLKPETLYICDRYVAVTQQQIDASIAFIKENLERESRPQLIDEVLSINVLVQAVEYYSGVSWREFCRQKNDFA